MLIHRELRTFQLHRLLLCYVQHAWVVDEIGHNFCCVFTVYTRSIDHHWLGGLIVVGYTLHVIASRLDAWSKHCASFLCMQCLPVTSLHFGINSTIFQCFGCIFSISQKVTYIMYCPKCLIFQILDSQISVKIRTIVNLYTWRLCAWTESALKFSVLAIKFLPWTCSCEQ